MLIKFHEFTFPKDFLLRALFLVLSIGAFPKNIELAAFYETLIFHIRRWAKIK